MTRGLETLLNIPFLEDALKEKGLLPEDHRTAEGIELPDQPETIEEGYSDESNDDALDSMISERAEQTLAMIEGVDHAEACDTIHDETLKHARNLVDLAYNVPENRMRGIFEQANNFYSKALDAKNSKRDSQLKAMKLALEKRRLDLEELRIKGVQEKTGDVHNLEDRNAIVRLALENRKKDK